MIFLKRINNHFYKKIFFPRYNSHWVLGNEYKEFQNICKRINLEKTYFPIKQYCYIPDKYYAIHKSKYHLIGNKVIFDYFHGNPIISPIFLELYNKLKYKINNFYKIRVSNSAMRDFFLNDKFDKDKFILLPIGLNTSFFPLRLDGEKTKMRTKYNLPHEAFIIGSFQKDGNGWNSGDTPKLIKGPDILIETIKIINRKISNLFILLTGPSRGYVKKELEKINVPYKHIYIKDYKKIYELYHTLDYYIITSREEGGPKALLECMASGIPIISTNVGQAVDLLNNKVNGYKVKSFNSEEIASEMLNNLYPNAKIIKEARKTAEYNDYNNQLETWKKIFPHL